MKKPKEAHRAWAEIIRTCTEMVVATGTLYLVGHEIGWW